MHENELQTIVDLVANHVIKSLNDKNIAKFTSGEIVSVDNENKTCTVKKPLDDKIMTAQIQTYEELSEGDNVLLLYWESYSNLIVFMKKKG